MATALSIIKKFVNSIDSEIKVGFDNDFCVNLSEKKIYIEDYEHPENEKLIKNFVKNKFNITMDPFLIGVLHEVGHLITYDPQLDEERIVLQSLLSLCYDKTQHKKYAEAYYSIPAELAATAWAVQYYKDNKQHCEDFLKELFC